MNNTYLTELSHGRVSSCPNIINKWLNNGDDMLDLTKEMQFQLFLLTLQHIDEV